MRILVTGVAGFLGGYISRAASAQGYETHGVDLPPHAAIQSSLASYHGGADRDVGALVKSIQPTLCVHCAGRASVGQSIVDPADDFRSGPPLTFAWLDALRAHAPGAGFVLLSSAAVYGNPATLPVSEDLPPAPISPYGFHKLQCELLCREFAEVYGVRTAAVRIFSAYGEGLRRQVLWDICRQVLHERRLDLRGTGNETRDFVHGADVAEGVLAVARSAAMRGEVYNLASGHATSVRELASLAASALGYADEPRFDGQVPVGDPLHWKADTAKISALGFAPSIALDAGIKRYAQWCASELAGGKV